MLAGSTGNLFEPVGNIRLGALVELHVRVDGKAISTFHADAPPFSIRLHEAAVDAIIAANPDQVRDVKEKPKTFGWFVGQVMKATGGKANPAAVNAILKKKLGVE